MKINTMSKMGLAFAVGVALSAGYVAIGAQAPAAPQVVVVQERCAEPDGDMQAASEPGDADGAVLPASLRHDPPAYGLSPAELDAMASRCEVRDDPPAELDDEIAAALGLSEAERESWAKAEAGVGGKDVAHRFVILRAFDPDGTKTRDLSYEESEAFIRAQLEQAGAARTEAEAAVYRELAEERAGLRTPPHRTKLEQASAWVRAERHRLSAGDRFAHELTQELGRIRVDELRRKFGGWPGQGTRVVGCPGGSPNAELHAELHVTGLDRTLVRRIVDAHMSEIRYCDSGEHPGRLIAEFAIGEDGKVDGEVGFAEASTIADAETRACVQEAVARWTFPKPREGAARVRYPFAFAPK